MNKYIRKYIWALIMLMAFTSCDKFLNVEPTDSMSGNNFWKSSKDADAYTLGIYRQFRNAFLVETPYFIMGDIRHGHVFESTYPNRLDIDAAARGNVTFLDRTEQPTSSNADLFWVRHLNWNTMSDWKRFYEIIHAANILHFNVSKLGEEGLLSNLEVKKYQSEAVFLRSLTYFLIIRLYGDVPYYTEAFHREALPRTSHITVAKNCLKDLEAVLNDFVWTYTDPTDNGSRAKKSGAITLMMNLNMWLAGFDTESKNSYYEQVDKLGDLLYEEGELQQGAIELLPIERVDEVFQGRSKEGFIEIPNNVNYAGYQAANSRKIFAFYVLDGLRVSLNQSTNAEMTYYKNYLETLYSPGESDKRKDLWFDEGMLTENGEKFRFFKFLAFEYKGANKAENYGNSIIVSRYPDAILLQAEACAELGLNDKATTLLNKVRSRSSATPYPGNGYRSLSEAIFYERCKELMGEGIYYFDLVRTGKIYDSRYPYVPMSFSAFQAGAWTWPIHENATLNNPWMTLNNYWR